MQTGVVWHWSELVQNAGNTRYSQPVTHASTNRAQGCLTSVIGREPVFSTWYGRRHPKPLFTHTSSEYLQPLKSNNNYYIYQTITTSTYVPVSSLYIL